MKIKIFFLLYLVVFFTFASCENNNNDNSNSDSNTKQTQTLTASISTVYLKDSEDTKTVQISGGINGSYDATSSNENIVTAAITNNGDLTITRNANFGDASITISNSGDSENNPASLTIKVKVRNGTANYPYPIATASELQAIGGDASSLAFHYIQTASIDISSITNFQPIGTNSNSFRGSFNGNGFKITGLKIDSTSDYVGLFGSSSATLQNIKLENIQVQGNNFVGGLVGLNYGTIRNSSASGSVQGETQVGGLVGKFYVYSNTTIQDSSASGSVLGNSDVGGLVGYFQLDATTTINIRNNHTINEVRGRGDFVGGLIGRVDNEYRNRYDITLANNYATGNVTGGGNYVGGLIGTIGQKNRYSNSRNVSIVTNNYATGNVTGGGYVGGLAGFIYYYNSSSGIVKNSYATGNVTGLVDATEGGNYVGGLIGDGAAVYSYATGNVTGNNKVGGLLGYNFGDTQNNYATGSVQGEAQVGGLIGQLGSGNTGNNYSVGSVQGDATVGGLIGQNSANVSSSYWNLETSGQTTSATGDARTSLQMLAGNNNNHFSGFSDASWDFVDASSYPILFGNIADATTQALHQVAGMIKLSGNSGTGFLVNKVMQTDITMDTNSISAGVIFSYLDVNLEATNDTGRIDFWDCASGSGDILLTTSSVNQTSIILKKGASTTDQNAWEKASGTNCGIIRSASSGLVQAGDKLHLEAIISKGNQSYSKKFLITFTN